MVYKTSTFFKCEKCDYITCKKFNFKRHLQSKKHFCSKMIQKRAKTSQSLVLVKKNDAIFDQTP